MATQNNAANDQFVAREHVVLIDRLRRFYLPLSKAEPVRDDIHQRNMLMYELEHLFSQVLGLEQRISITRSPLVSVGASPELEAVLAGQDLTIATMLLSQYSVAAAKFATITGFLVQQISDPSLKVNDYARDAIGEIFTYRDKIGAHLAGATYNKKDNEAERLHSKYGIIGFVQGRIVANPVTAIVFGNRSAGSKTSTSESLGHWVPATEHLKLRARFWPTRPLFASRPNHISLGPIEIEELGIRTIDPSTVPGACELPYQRRQPSPQDPTPPAGTSQSNHPA